MDFFCSVLPDSKNLNICCLEHVNKNEQQTRSLKSKTKGLKMLIYLKNAISK